MKTYTWRDYWKSKQGMDWFWIDWNYYACAYPWWNPRRHKVGGKLLEICYYIKCALWKRYSTVTPRTLSPTWHDRDEVMLHACFAILEDVIKNEKIFERVVDDGDPMDGKSWAWALNEMRFLYLWWTSYRPEREAEYERRLTAWCGLRGPWGSGEPETPTYKKALAQLREMDDHIRDKEDNDMLKRLIDVRCYLWT